MPLSENDIEPFLIPKILGPINVITGIFLKSVFFLNPELSKCVITGIFKDRDNSLGVLINGRKGNIFLSYEIFCQLCDRFNEITIALSSKTQYSIGEHLQVINVFGNQYACISDGRHSLTLDFKEWDQFIKSIPLICRALLDLFYLESDIDKFIKSDTEVIPDYLPSDIFDRLIRELQLCRQ